MSGNMLDRSWVASKEVAVSRVGEELVLLHLGSGTYYGLDPLGTRIWKDLQDRVPPRALCAAIAAEFEEELAQVERDVALLLSELAEHQLIVEG
jgi:hypothetical protein